MGEEKHAAERRHALNCPCDADEVCGSGLARGDGEHPEEADRQFLFVLLLLPRGGIRLEFEDEARDGHRAPVGFEGDAPAPKPAKMVFTPNEVKSLNAFQRAGVRHPFTCVRGRDRNHLDGEGVLVATARVLESGH